MIMARDEDDFVTDGTEEEESAFIKTSGSSRASTNQQRVHRVPTPGPQRNQNRCSTDTELGPVLLGINLQKTVSDLIGVKISVSKAAAGQRSDALLRFLRIFFSDKLRQNWRTERSLNVGSVLENRDHIHSQREGFSLRC